MQIFSKYMMSISNSKGGSMKERMERFARGEFEEHLPKIDLPKEPVSWEMEPDSSFKGVFKFRSENGLRIRGYVLCSDGNLKITTPQFFGQNVKIEFTYHSRHAADGDKKRGKLILITNAGEFLVPFQVHIRKKVTGGGDFFHE